MRGNPRPRGRDLIRMQNRTDAMVRSILFHPTKRELREELAEAIRNTAKLSTSSTTGENDASDH